MPADDLTLNADVAIIGAGVAGLAAALALAERGIDCAVFNTSRGVSGRAATRRRDGFAYDHGANFFTLDDARTQALADGLADLARIEGRVYVHDAAGTVTPGDRTHEHARWTCRAGVSGFAKHLAARLLAPVSASTRIVAMEHADERWHLVAEGGARFGPYRAVVLTPPAPQSAEIVRAAVETEDAAPLARFADALAAVPYRAQFSLVYAFDAPAPRPADACALFNADRGHAIAWLGFEETKPGHVPIGCGLIVAQMSPAWTAAHYDEAPDRLIEAGRTHVEALVGPLPSVRFTDTQRWRYALPDAAIDADACESAEAFGLYVAGDAVAGKGRVEGALLSGLDIGARVAV